MTPWATEVFGLRIRHDGGAERRQVVCGAPNVAAGRKYPFAPVGAMVPIHDAAVFSALAAFGLLTVMLPLSSTMLPPP